jgi:hypothetical protein
MQDRAIKLFSIFATALSMLAALVVLFDVVGGSQVVWAAVSASALGLIPSLIGIWLLRSLTLERVKEKARVNIEEGNVHPILVSVRDRAMFSTQVIPAFLDAGVQRTRAFFLDLIPTLDLSPEEEEAEERFVIATAEDSGLARQEKIERLVLHFTGEQSVAEEAEQLSRGSEAGGPEA